MAAVQDRVATPRPTLPRWRFWAPLAVQVAIVAFTPLPQLYATSHGTVVRLQTAPVDPTDLLRGRYVRLGYAIGAPDAMQDLPGWDALHHRESGTLYWTLAPGKPGGVWRAVAIADRYPKQVPAGDVVLSGTMENGRATFGLEEYYVPDRREHAVTAALASYPGEGVAEVRVGSSGAAGLTGLTVHGQRF